MSDPLVLGVLASGRGSNLQAIMDAISGGSLQATVGVVLSNKKEAQALDRAKAQGIPAYHFDPKGYPGREAYDTVLLERLRAYDVGLVVLAGYMRLLTSVLVRPYLGRMINIHPSLLPAFPGLHAQRQAIEYGVKVSGCTIHFVDEKMDHGPVIAQSVVPVLPGDTEDALADRILIEEHCLLPKVIQMFAEGRLSIEGRIVRDHRHTRIGAEG
ncbi:MAG: phosphoribosylglycinamide formyltransferase [Nitrospiria bacterium]